MEINRVKLVEALEKVVPALGTNVIVPAFQCFQFHDNHVAATDGSLIIQTPIPDGADPQLECYVPAPQFIALLRGIKAKTVSIERDGNNVLVRSKAGKIKGTFSTVDVSGFTELPAVDYKDAGPSFVHLADAFNFCRYNVSHDEAKGPYCGVRVIEKRVYGTDQLRLARYQLDEAPFELPVTVPLKFIGVMLRHRKHVIKVGALGDNQIGVRLEDGTFITSSLLAGDYKDLEGLFPDKETEFLFVEFPETLQPVLERHIEFLRNVDSKSKLICITVEEKVCTIVSTDKELGVLEEEIDIVSPIGQRISFDINPMFLKDVSQVANEFNYHEGLVLFLTERLSYMCREAVEV